jgi:hypothetical protein
MAPRLFALDQGFPQPIVDALHDYLKHEAQLTPVASIDERLTDIDDWELLLSLHHHPDPWDGLVSTDDNMLNQPRELATLVQTKLTLVACRAAGHDPVRATGLLLTNLSSICKQTARSRPQLWRLGGGAHRPASDPWDYFTRAANKRSMSVGELRGEEWLSQKELARDPLTDDRPAG